MDSEVKELAERLKRTISWKDEWGEYRSSVVNPDGPAAADLITRQAQRLADQERATHELDKQLDAAKVEIGRLRAENHKFKWQVRDTCARAEKAEAENERLRARMAELEEAKIDTFNHGYMIAAANIVHLHDEPIVAEDVIRENGISAKEIRALGLTEYDMSVIAPILGNMKRRDAYSRKRTTLAAQQKEVG